jgi:hypothetical protein
MLGSCNCLPAPVPFLNSGSSIEVPCNPWRNMLCTRVRALLPSLIVMGDLIPRRDEHLIRGMHADEEDWG